MVFEHSGHIEILNGHDVKPLHEQGSQLVQGILSDIRDARMKPRDAPVGLAHILRPGDRHPFGDGLAGL